MDSTNSVIDHNKFKLDNGGVKNYFWPINRAKVINLSMKMIQETVTHFSRAHKEKELQHYDNLKITNIYFILRMLNLYQNKMLTKDINKLDELELCYDKYSKMDLQKDYLIVAKNGFRKALRSKSGMYSRLRNVVATLVKRDNFIRKDISSLDLDMQKDIICTGASPLASRYLKQLNQSAYQVKISSFFPGANAEDLDVLISKRKNTGFRSTEYDKYIEIFINLFNKCNVSLSKEELKEVCEWRRKFLICVSYYQDILINKSDFIPNQLWTSSAGILWNKILAIEVRKRGGVVTTFDHAYGANLSQNTIMPFVEFQEIDLFVTHSETFVQYLTKAAPDQLYIDYCPSIISIK